MKKIQPLRLNESDESLDDVINFIKNLRDTTLEYDGNKSDGSFSFSTRENGDVGSETASKKDWDDVFSVLKQVKEKFPQFDANMEEVDEWVSITVSEKKKEYEAYIFCKHTGGIVDHNSSGFQHRMEKVDWNGNENSDWKKDIIEEITRFTDLSTSDAEEAIKEVKNKPTNTTIGWRKGASVLLQKAKTEGDYNYSLVRTNDRWY